MLDKLDSVTSSPEKKSILKDLNDEFTEEETKEAYTTLDETSQSEQK